MTIRAWPWIVFALTGFLPPSLPAADQPLPPTAEAGAKLQVVHDESQGQKRFFEGPSYDPRTDTLYFTAFAKDGSQILKLDATGQVTVFLDKTDGINGTFRSRKGDLLGCQGGKGRLVRISLSAKGGPPLLEVLADNFEGKPLGELNDLVEDARGGIYFTSPDFKEKKTSAVYYRTPEGKVERVVTDLQTPNGIYLQKGGLALYISDSAQKNVRVYPVDPVSGAVGAKDGKVFFDAPTENKADPDGMTMDERGNMYFTGRGGIWTVEPGGKPLGMIPIPEFCSNCTFGGKEGRTLYMTCQDRVYKLAMNVRGWEFASRHEKPSDPPLRFKQVAIDPSFRSEGVAIADVNRDGKLDILASDVWYEAPDWKIHEIREPKKYDGTRGYSRGFASWSEDWTGDGYPDLIVIPFPGEAAHWYENPKGKPERWKEHELWHSACNETPLFADLLGTGQRVLIMGYQPPGKENEGIMAYFTPPRSGQGKWEEHRVSGPKGAGTFRFSHGLGVGDVNGDGLSDIICTEGWYQQPPKAAEAKEWEFHPAPFGPESSDMYAYDLNGDGLNDVIHSSAHRYGIWWEEQLKGADGKTEWRKHLIDDSFSQSHALHLIDMNGDGVKDLVTGKRYFAHQGHDPGEFEPLVVYWFEVKLGNPPQFIPHLIDLGVGVSTQFVIGDLNGDRLADIVVSNKRGVHVLFQEPHQAN
jgi:sugar lactone lactonase YvrE